MTVKIRRVMRDDKPQWAELWRGYLAFYETELPLAAYDACFEAFFQADAAAPRCLVAEDKGALLGLVHYLHHAHCWRPEGAIYLQDLFTAPEARGQGVGGALIKAVYDAADARNVPYVYWLTQEFNATARSLYDKIGVVTPFVKYQRPQ